MTARDYIPAQGDILNKAAYYHNNFPRRIKIIKITRTGRVHFQDLTRSGTHQMSTVLHTLRKCFVLSNEMNINE